MTYILGTEENVEVVLDPCDREFDMFDDRHPDYCAVCYEVHWDDNPCPRVWNSKGQLLCRYCEGRPVEGTNSFCRWCDGSLSRDAANRRFYEENPLPKHVIPWTALLEQGVNHGG